MSAEAAVLALEHSYLRNYPREAARRLESLPAAEAAKAFEAQPPEVMVPVWEQLAGYVQERLIELVPEGVVGRLLSEMDSPLAAELLATFEPRERARWLARMDPGAARPIERLMAYPPDTAGRFMDPRISSFRGDMTASEAIERMRGFKKKRDLRELFLVDDDSLLTGRVEIQDLVTAPAGQPLRQIARPVSAAVLDTAPREEVVGKIEQHRVPALPVVGVTGRLVGVIHQAALLAAVQEEASLDIQTMVGASKDERALSGSWFAVSKRLPWLQINLATAFLAASVVGLFEDTIARFTALAVLLPVVAGQSGNAGAQALAVTMRGLALREISARHLPRVVFKEISAGLMNGIAVAVACAIGVWIWSRSLGLVAVISISMVISMMAAGFSGAAIPIVLNRLGFDPAQSSSIVLTTVTDVVGFFSFLGVATALQAWL